MAFIEEVEFARKLASNDLETRQKSERLLKKWLGSKAKKGMTDLEMRVLWKGLFASMFMSDKPLVQEQLASDLSNLVHVFPKCNLGIKFCQVFFDTMTKEWHGIDRLRLDKFYMFIRCFIKEVFVYLQAQGWPRRNLKEFVTIVTVYHDKCPGLVLHIAELFLPELQNAATEKISCSNSMLLLRPWFELAAISKDKILVQLIEENILDRIIKGHKLKWLSLDWGKLGSVVWEIATNEGTLARNRKILYKFHSGISEHLASTR